MLRSVCERDRARERESKREQERESESVCVCFRMLKGGFLEHLTIECNNKERERVKILE